MTNWTLIALEGMIFLNMIMLCVLSRGFRGFVFAILNLIKYLVIGAAYLVSGLFFFIMVGSQFNMDPYESVKSGIVLFIVLVIVSSLIRKLIQSEDGRERDFHGNFIENDQDNK